MAVRRQLRDPWATVPGALFGAAAWTAGVRPLAAGAVAVVVMAVKVVAVELGGGQPEELIPPAADRPGEDIPAPVTAADAHGYVLRRDGHFWRVGSGEAVFALQDVKGLRYLHLLLGHPNQDFFCVELAQLCEGVAVSARPSAGLPEGTGIAAEAPLPVLDERALAEYRKRKRELDIELEEAKRFNDEGRVEMLESEIDALKQEILGATFPPGGVTQTGGQVEKARSSVQRAIKKGIDDIEPHDPSLARHLRSTIRTGRYCRYEPDPRQPPTWQL